MGGRGLLHVFSAAHFESEVKEIRAGPWHARQTPGQANASELPGKMELTSRHSLLCLLWQLPTNRCSLYFMKTVHSVHILSEWIVCVCARLSVITAVVGLLRMHTSRAPQFEPQVYTYPSHSYINSYHSALMLQFSVYQNHLNPDLLSDRVWMKTMWSSTTVMQGNNYFVCSTANNISYGLFWRETRTAK